MSERWPTLESPPTGQRPQGVRLSAWVDGRIVPPNNLELPVTDHCNLTCRDCNHSSPAMAPWFANPDQVFQDLSLLARFYRPKRLKVLGGEPLLHKNLGAVLSAARASGICDSMYLTTNGMLLERASAQVWSCLDEVEVSAYPGCLNASWLQRARALAEEHGVRLTYHEYSHFRSTLSARAIEDPALVGQIYDSCKVAHYWGCHMVRQGQFFKCPRSAYLPVLLGDESLAQGLPLNDEPDFARQLLEFLNDPQPLAACRHCLGTVGRRHPHRQLPRSEWRSSLQAPLEELLDRQLLARAVLDITASSADEN